MLFFRKRKSEDGSAAPPQEEPARKPRPVTVSLDALLDGALDSLAALLRAFALESFEVEGRPQETFVEQCEAWARHALTAAPLTPGSIEIDDDDGARSAHPLGQRNWRDLRIFFRTSRKEETAFVYSRLDQLKQIIWDMVDGLRSVSSGERQADQAIQETLIELEEASRCDSLESLRDAVGKAVVTIRSALDQQREQLTLEIRSMGAKLATMRDELMIAKRQMELDPLTEVYNRGAFDAALRRYVNLAVFAGQPLTLLMVDLDHFKAINDRYGHPTGDVVIRAVADTIVKCFPRRNDFIARYGGEEYAVILFDVEGDNAQQLVQRLLERVRALTVSHEGKNLRLTCSIGYACLSGDESPEELLKRTDQALYQAKNAGRDQAVASARLHLHEEASTG